MLQKGSETLQTDVNEMLEASKDVIEQMNDEDAVFIRSECRLITRGYLQLKQTLKGRIEHMQVRRKYSTFSCGESAGANCIGINILVLFIYTHVCADNLL